MSYDVVLRAGHAALDTRNLREALRTVSARDGVQLHLTDEGTIAFGLGGSPLDRRALALDLELKKGSITLSVQDDLAPLASWLGGALVGALGCTSEDPAATPSSLASVQELLERHEEEAGDGVIPTHADPRVEAVLQLVRLGRIAIVPGGEVELAELVQAHRRPDRLYELLLDSDAVDDLFLSQSEFVAALRG